MHIFNLILGKTATEIGADRHGEGREDFTSEYSRSLHCEEERRDAKP